MKKIKIIQKFFSATEAASAAKFQRAKAKRDGVLVAKIEVVDAVVLYRKNGWFKVPPFKMGRPVDGQFLVIIYYMQRDCENVKPNTIKYKIKKAIKENKVKSSFHIVRLRKDQAKSIFMTHFGPIKTKVPGWKFCFNIASTIPLPAKRGRAQIIDLSALLVA